MTTFLWVLAYAAVGLWVGRVAYRMIGTDEDDDEDVILFGVLAAMGALLWPLTVTLGIAIWLIVHNNNSGGIDGPGSKRVSTATDDGADRHDHA
jgi:hypothetical protein